MANFPDDVLLYKSLTIILLLLFFGTVGAQIAHHQYFKISPQSEVNVIEGSTVVLQCVVGNQRGPVQWAKDGFVLGYDRNIPGFPRYSMIGDASLGVHNLRVVDAKSEDNGEFQCQVCLNSNSKNLKTKESIFVLRLDLVGKTMHRLELPQK